MKTIKISNDEYNKLMELARRQGVNMTSDKMSSLMINELYNQYENSGKLKRIF